MDRGRPDGEESQHFGEVCLLNSIKRGTPAERNQIQTSAVAVAAAERFPISQTDPL